MRLMYMGHLAEASNGFNPYITRARKVLKKGLNSLG